jgi:hypothetical protein
MSVSANYNHHNNKINNKNNKSPSPPVTPTPIHNITPQHKHKSTVNNKDLDRKLGILLPIVLVGLALVGLFVAIKEALPGQSCYKKSSYSQSDCDSD